ncbi:MAG: 23S rRNA (uracil(1939)-C(5))-methyltransferase RlmD [Lachnospiraceae bacterium]|nr:23S rRNA (uracil(1939)-C(5))-methyltransferase RlmD [Lachnospiraceae bacterium]
MKKKSIIREGKVVGLNFPNKGIVQTDDGICVVKNTIPGQTVSFFSKRKRAGVPQGVLVDIIEKSVIETLEGCRHFRTCGGCVYQTVPIEEEDALKEKMVKDILASVVSNFPESAAEGYFEDIVSSPVHSSYRNKMEFSFGDMVKGGEMCLGMHVTGHFNDVVTVDDCNIAEADMVEILKATLDFAKKTGLPFLNKRSHEGYFRHLLVRKGRYTGEILVDLVTTSQFEPDLNEYVKSLNGLKLEGEIVGILNTLNNSLGDAVINEDTRILYGRDHFYDEILGLKFRINPFSFFQTNTLGAEVLYKKVREFAGELNVNTLFDLYCGTGTITQLMADCAKNVVGVELVEEAVEAAKINAENNGLHNIKFLAGDVGEILSNLEELPDMIIVDPPREGMTPKALEKVVSYGVKNIVYVSCKITSLARDLPEFFKAGYSLKRAVPVNMFPRTTGVETVTLLINQNAKAKHHVRVGIDAEDYYRIKDSEKKEDE